MGKGAEPWLRERAGTPLKSKKGFSWRSLTAGLAGGDWVFGRSSDHTK